MKPSGKKRTTSAVCIVSRRAENGSAADAFSGTDTDFVALSVDRNEGDRYNERRSRMQKTFCRFSSCGGASARPGVPRFFNVRRTFPGSVAGDLRRPLSAEPQCFFRRPKGTETDRDPPVGAAGDLRRTRSGGTVEIPAGEKAETDRMSFRRYRQKTGKAIRDPHPYDLQLI